MNSLDYSSAHSLMTRASYFCSYFLRGYRYAG